MERPNCFSVGLFLLATSWSLLLLAPEAHGEELAPPYFNLADKRRIYASATCGEDINEPELYCKLVGSSASSSDDDYNIIKGQVIHFYPLFCSIH